MLFRMRPLVLGACVGFQRVSMMGAYLSLPDTIALRDRGLLDPGKSLMKLFVPRDSISLQVYYLILKMDSTIKRPKPGFQGVEYGTFASLWPATIGMDLALHRRKPAHDGKCMFT